MDNQQTVIPQVPKKPSRLKGITLTVGGFVLVALAILYVASSVISTTGPKAKNQSNTSPTAAEAIPGFSGQANTAANSLKNTDEKLREVQEMWVNARGPLPMVCNTVVRDSLQGRRWTVPATSAGMLEEEYVCTDKDKWELVQPGLTELQKSADKKANGIDSRGPREHAPTAAEVYAYKAQEAFKSDSVQVHFADVNSPEDRAEAAQREGDALIRAANEGRLSGQTQPQATAPEQRHEPTDEEVYPWDIFLGQKHRIFEQTYIETAILSRIEGEFGGPVKLFVTRDVYGLDKSTLLIPQGTVILGTAGTSHGSTQRRLTLEFHRMIMPDGYCARLEKAVGADQQGATGLTGQVDTHWKSLIATAAILGAVEGLGTGVTFASSNGGLLELSAGMNRQTAEEGTQILNQQMNRNSSIRVYEGTRVVLKTGEDLLVPAWENHRVPKNL